MLDIHFETFVEFESKISNDQAKLAETRLVGLLFMRSGQELTDKDVLPSLDYFDQRSGPYVDFYLPGWQKIVSPGEKRSIEWVFDIKKFIHACEVIGDVLDWRYSGGADLLLFTSRRLSDKGNKAFLDFSEVVSLPLHVMKEGKVGPSVLFERIFSYAQHYHGFDPLAALAMQELRVSGVKAFINGLISWLARGGKEEVEYARHFIIRDIYKRSERELGVVSVRLKRRDH
jgi:hypothetical protein